MSGLNEAKKKKLFINKCNQTLKENPSTIKAVRETHYKNAQSAWLDGTIATPGNVQSYSKYNQY